MRNDTTPTETPVDNGRACIGLIAGIVAIHLTAFIYLIAVMPTN